MIRQKEVDSAIVPLRQHDNTPCEPTEIWFTILGKQESFTTINNIVPELTNKLPIVPINSILAYAKLRQVRDGSVYYFIKTDTSGQFLNPLGMNELRLNRQISGRVPFVFQEVVKRAFIKYVQFLSTKNPALLHQAHVEAY